MDDDQSLGSSSRAEHLREGHPRRRANDRIGVDEILKGGGETGRLMRAFEWARSPLGPVEAWPTSLRTVAGVVLRSKFPMCLWWGPRLHSIYNDAYRPILGSKHPSAIAQPGSVVWSEIWHILGPLADRILEGSEVAGRMSEADLLELIRGGAA